MPFVVVNGAQLYYQAFGADVPHLAPIVLIHGSTSTGQNDWTEVAVRLAERWRVLVPDCRGHGQSTNPNLTYSFFEMAADTAAFIRALGYERAHIIGHSNGGNVALVTLMEHPEVVASAVLQAANAYVSPDLLEREPPLFDPDRVAHEDPAWRDEMIRLHGPTHGAEYWRTLLKLTLHATITEPSYTAEQLACVQRPVLAIQGERDAVNSVGQHAQFLARHIPHAHLWLPSNVGHNVHLEIPEEWLMRVSAFLGDASKNR